MTDAAKPKTSRHRYANALSIEVAAAVNGLYKFNTEEQAARKLATIGHNFTLAREQAQTTLPSITLWMREYELTEEEAAKGFLGNFGRLQVEEQDDGLFTIHAHKIERALNLHPVRKRPATRTPNWGHPILRAIQKGTHYTTLEAAQDDLQKLQLEYPETTVPATNKLFLMIFSRRDDPKNPIQKYVLEINNLQGGGFVIECALNDYKAMKLGIQAQPGTDSDDEALHKPGHFASMVKLKRRKKK
jgi:hypothetical protein